MADSTTAAAADANIAHPNILFILSDDHRSDCVGALGNPHIMTPTLDKLVEQGVSFSRTYVMGSMEGAVCTPSRSMMQTGRSLFHLPRANLRKGYAEFAAAMKDKTEGRDWALLSRVAPKEYMDLYPPAAFHCRRASCPCIPSTTAR